MNVSEVVFCKDRYDSEELMWADILAQLKILMANDYVVSFRCDEPGLGIYVIEFDSANKDLSDYRLRWMYYEDLELLEAAKAENDVENNV